jgi:hypothetical protein
MVKLPKVEMPEVDVQHFGNIQAKLNKPVINFAYLHKCNVSCFNKLSKYSQKNKEKKVFDDLQRFLSESDNYNSLEELITNYTSAKGSMIEDSNEFVKAVIKRFKNAYPDKKGLVKSKLIHIHTKRNGKGEFVLFGTTYENNFYVLAFDPGHEYI